MHYYQHNIGDYRRDTAHLTLLEHGVYRQLIDQYYLNEKPLPLDLGKICRLMSVHTEEEKNAIKNVLEDFFMEVKNGYAHKRCEAAIEEYHSQIEKKVKASNARWNKDDDAHAMHMDSTCNAHGMLTNNQEPITINQEPITINHKPLTSIKGDDSFEQFWSLYPRKVGKGAAYKSWQKENPKIEEVEIALSWQKQSKQWFGGKYIPNPATYINQHRWKDEPTEEVTF
jgi:uncharacterized protein YdaU (DUF1376 family)